MLDSGLTARPVRAALLSIVLPVLGHSNAVAEAEMVQGRVGVDHLIGDPGARLAGSRRVGAVLDHLFKAGVGADRPILFGKPLKPAAAQMNLAWNKAEAWIRAPP